MKSFQFVKFAKIVHISTNRDSLVRVRLLQTLIVGDHVDERHERLGLRLQPHQNQQLHLLVLVWAKDGLDNRQQPETAHQIRVFVYGDRLRARSLPIRAHRRSDSQHHRIGNHQTRRFSNRPRFDYSVCQEFEFARASCQKSYHVVRLLFE